MKTTLAMNKLSRLIVICAGVIAVAGFSAARSFSGSITLVNNSSRAVVHIYFAHANQDDWGSDQLGEVAVNSGQSTTLGNINWDQSQLKVIAEDQDGCFASTVVNSNDSSTWTITNDTARDCGY